ncbi:MAG: hypothetical protein M1132_10230 [Chloroflexi bacterium]|nr:hypothetical protein [Chloroflexota bacterium]
MSLSHHSLALACVLLAFVAILLVLFSFPATAEPILNPDDPVNPPYCSLPNMVVTAPLSSIGLPLLNQTVVVDGSRAKITDADDTCANTRYHSLPVGSFSWALISRPAGSTATLAGTNTLTPTLKLDKAGAYVVRFSACSSVSCDITWTNSQTGRAEVAHVPAFTKDLAITSVDQYVLRPETDPVLPASAQVAVPPSNFPDASAKCAGGGGVIDPQWVTVEHWDGPQDYKLVEGKVVRSLVSTKDNFLNHDSQDQNFGLEVDPKYWSLISTAHEFSEPYRLGVEWERGSFPEAFWGTIGDRASVFGYWIHDCGHPPFYTEIHPPVGIATQRRLPVHLPSTSGPTNPGGNVYVPGIITDIWFNRNSGEITDNCSRTALHQPGAGNYPEPIFSTLCIPTPLNGGPSPIHRVYTFNIYLPRSPHVRMTELGYPTPAPDLYINTIPSPYGQGSGGPQPVITQVTEGNVTYLEVSIDLTSFTGDKYARRIEAAWVYPSADNWGLKRYKFTIHGLDVRDDGDDHWTRGNGDWRWWVSLNNTYPGWTKVIECNAPWPHDNSCVGEGWYNFGGRPWQTDAPTSDRNLGSDLLLWPNQYVWLHASGYEEDTITNDNTGVINAPFYPPSVPDTLIKTPNFCTPPPTSNYEQYWGVRCTDYTMHYSLSAGTSVLAQLSTYGQYLATRYTITPGQSPTCQTIDPKICVVSPALVYAALHPQDYIMLPGSPSIPMTSTTLFKPQSQERYVMTDITIADMNAVIAAHRKSDPAALDATMKDWRKHIDAFLAGPLPEDARAHLPRLRDNIPYDLWQTYFGDLPVHILRLPIIRKQ